MVCPVKAKLTFNNQEVSTYKEPTAPRTTEERSTVQIGHCQGGDLPANKEHSE